MEHRVSLLQRPRLKRMSHRVAEVQRLAYVLLIWVLLHDALLHLYRLCHKLLQQRQVWVLKVKGQQVVPCPAVAYESVLKHLAETGAQVIIVERVEERRVQQHILAVVEHTHLVLQTVKVDARLSSHRCVDHCQQRGGDVNEVDAALKRGSGKSSEVGNHSAAQVHHARVACRPVVAQLLPHLCQAVERLVCVGVANGYDVCLTHAVEPADLRPAFLTRHAVGKHKQTVMFTLGDGYSQILLQIV